MIVTEHEWKLNEVGWITFMARELAEPYVIGANCPGTSGTVPNLELLSRVPHGTGILAKMSRKF